MTTSAIVNLRVLESSSACKNRIKAGDEKWARTFARDAVSWARVLIELRDSKWCGATVELTSTEQHDER